MEKLKSEKKSLSSIGKYLPVFVILLAISIMIGSTFAYFTDKTEEESTLTFSKVELSGETTTGINGKLRDVIPGTPLVDGALKFSKSIDSEAIYVRAKISFSLPSEYANDNDMKQMVDLLRSATDFNIVSEAQNGAVWSAKDGNYFYLVNSTDTTKLMRVDTIDTYTLSNEIVVPRDLKNLPDNAQYMKSVNFHVAFEAIQADNVSDVLSETKTTFNVLFPATEAEKYVDNGNNGDDVEKVSVTFKGLDGQSDLETIEINAGDVINEPVVDIPLDANNEPKYLIEGWYTEYELVNKFKFGTAIESDLTLYPNPLEVSEGLEFIEVEEDGEVVGYNVAYGMCEQYDVVVPSTHNGLPVKGIADNGFENYQLEHIYLPSSLTFLGDCAFFGCVDLELTEIPAGITSLGSGVFYGCSKIALTELPAGITYIGDSTFYECEYLALTELPAGVTYIGESAFNYCRNLAITELPASVSTVGTYAFLECTSLPSFDNVYYLTFAGTNNKVVVTSNFEAETTTWPENVTMIAGGAFDFCSDLAITELPDTITYIGDYVFRNCRNLALNSLPSGITYIGVDAFKYCSNITLSELPSGVTYIGNYAFYECINITLTSLPSGLTYIGENAFAYCESLALTSIPSGVTYIGGGAFYGCTLLPSNDSVYYLTIEGTSNNVVVAIELWNITSVTWPSNVTMILGYVFEGCYDLVITELPDTITYIGEHAFYGCENITLTSLPSGLTYIGTEAFYECINITLTSLPSGLTYIGGNAFVGCTLLPSNDSVYYLTIEGTSNNVVVAAKSWDITSVTWPSNVTMILDGAFQCCFGLVITELPDTITYIGESAFADCEKLALTSLPSGLTYIGAEAFAKCYNLALISLPSSVTYIGEDAFLNCRNLEFVLCENAEVETLVQGKGVVNAYIYTLQTTGYESGAFDTEVEISDSVTIYTAEIDGVYWVKTSDNKYYKCIA